MTNKHQSDTAGFEEALEPELPICDPHHHLWDYPDSRYLVDEWLADIQGGHRIQETVYVECRHGWDKDGDELLQPVGETKFIEALASGMDAGPRVAAGIVAFADLSVGARVSKVLEAHMKASERVRGIRYMSAWDASDRIHNSQTNPPVHLLAEAPFREGLSCLSPLELVFDAWLYHPQLPELTDLARALPGLTIVLDHVGGPLGIGPYAGRREEILKSWRRDMTDLARCENVYVKLGGLTMSMSGFGWHKLPAPPDSATLADAMAPYFHHCIEKFGPERCMFESNFPVDKVSCSYTVLWNAFKRLTRGYSAAERSCLFRETAVKVYRLENAR